MLTRYTTHFIVLTAVLAWATAAQTQAEEAGDLAASPAAATAGTTATAAQDPAADPAPEKGPPLPFHTIEGYGGGAITPMAYLVNPGADGIPFKYNDGISDISNRLGGALSLIGYRSDTGEDYTFTATNTLAKAAFGRPLTGPRRSRLS